MKKSNLTAVLLLLMVFALSIAGCKKKDDTTNQTDGELTGVWTCTAFNYSGSTVVEYSGQSSSIDFTGEGYDIDFNFTLSENPNVGTTEGKYSVKLITSVSGVTLDTQYVEGQNFAFTGEWTRNGNTLTMINQTDEPSDATIVKLTDTELELNISEDQSYTISGSTTATITNYTIKFVR